MYDDGFWGGYPFRWDHDDRLIRPTIDFPYFPLHHGPTGTAAVNWLPRGAWSDAAIHEVRTCLASALPGRYHAQVIGTGVFQVFVCLGVVPALGARNFTADEGLRDWRDDGDLDATLVRVDWAFDRMVARSEGRTPREPGPDDVAPLALPQPLTRRAFAGAQSDAAGREVLEVADFTDSDFRGATWAKLRQATHYDLNDRVYTYRSRL